MSEIQKPEDNDLRPEDYEYVVEEIAVSDAPKSSKTTVNLGLGTFGCAMSPVLIIAIIAFVAITIFNGVFGIFDGVFGGIREFFDIEPTTAQVTTTQTIVNSIQPLGQFVSVSAQVAKADIRVEVAEGFQNACGRTAFYVAQGAIEAGIDLINLTEDAIETDAETGNLTVTLPPAQVTSCRLEFIDRYRSSTSACGPSWDTLRQLAGYTAVVEFRDDSIEGGILERAEREASISLSSFLGLATGRQVNIVFVERGEPIHPPSCIPETPGDWTFDGENNVWSG